jgi:hypothetical protein
LGNYDQVTTFENSEGLGSWIGKKVDKAAGAVTKVARNGAVAVTNKGKLVRTLLIKGWTKKKKLLTAWRKKESDEAAKSIVAALRIGNTSVDHELQNAWMVVKKQRRKDKKLEEMRRRKRNYLNKFV